MTSPVPEYRSKLLLACLVSLLAAGLVLYSQTAAFAWDEGHHLLTAQLMTAAAVLLTAEYLLRRFPVPGWAACCLSPAEASGSVRSEASFGILTCAGLYAAGSRLVAPDRPFWPVAAVSVLVCLGLAKSLYDEREDFTWRDVEAIARKVNEVTPPQAALLADELTYFVSRHAPPSGMELADSHKLDFPSALAAELHVISRAELERRLQAGVFDTVETWDTAERIAALGPPRLYTHRVEGAEANLFWGAPARAARPRP